MIGGRYTLDREIGRGGMGAVWLGRDEVLGRPVAVKRVGAAPGVSSPDVVRAEREARIAARVNHPSVVAVFDLVQDEEQKWLVMEYVEGSTLAERVQREGPMSADRLAPLLAQAAEALQASHAVGIVHRDVKPSNILVTHDDRVKLSDFGIARAEAETVLTATGLVTGSPAYISPEVASGRQATPASDVWSLGATAYHALTGRPPYEVRDNVLGTLYRIVHEDPPRLDDGGWVAPFVAGAMVKDPERRWSMADAAAFLRSRGAAPVAAPAGSAAGPSTVSAADPFATQVLAPDQRSPAAPAGAQPAGVTTPPTPPPSGSTAGSRRARRRRDGLVLAVAAAAVLLVGLLVLLVTLGDDPEGGPSADTSSPTNPSSSAAEQRRPDEATAMEDFARSYLETAPTDVQAGFAMLAPAYQDASGGLDGYADFWGDVSNVRVDAIEASPPDLTVTYTYRYDLAGAGAREETVRLQLEPAGDGYLIADAATIG